MTRSEYLQLLKKSVSFRKLDSVSKARFRHAKGLEMHHYAQVFRDEADVVAQAYGKLQDDTKHILADFTLQARHDNSARISEKELMEHTQELSQIEDILKDI